ncbi:MAG: enamine deaminase RidA (YjgF/YER057c/UK114 family) [Candidatus Azotimanducaceae bacterium]
MGSKVQQKGDDVMTIQKKTFRSGPFKDFIAQGAQVDNVLYLSGQVGMDLAGNVPASLAEQTTELG